MELGSSSRFRAAAGAGGRPCQRSGHPGHGSTGLDGGFPARAAALVLTFPAGTAGGEVLQYPQVCFGVHSFPQPCGKAGPRREDWRGGGRGAVGQCQAVPPHKGFEGRRAGPVAVRVSWLEFDLSSGLDEYRFNLCSCPTTTRCQSGGELAPWQMGSSGERCWLGTAVQGSPPLVVESRLQSPDAPTASPCLWWVVFISFIS